MHTTIMLITGLLLVTAAAVMATGYCCYKSGFTRGRYDQSIDRYETRLAENRARAPRHAATAARKTPDSPGQHGTPPPQPAVVQTSARRPWIIRVDAVTAADIRPVAMPRPTDLIRPQPGRDSGPGTITMPRLPSTRVQLTTATTGEIRAVGDAIVSRIESGELVP